MWDGGDMGQVGMEMAQFVLHLIIFQEKNMLKAHGHRHCAFFLCVFCLNTILVSRLFWSSSGCPQHQQFTRGTQKIEHNNAVHTKRRIWRKPGFLVQLPSIASQYSIYKELVLTPCVTCYLPGKFINLVFQVLLGISHLGIQSTGPK